jgi:hypothetical protein
MSLGMYDWRETRDGEDGSNDAREVFRCISLLLLDGSMDL